MTQQIAEAKTLTPDQITKSSDNVTVAMDTEITKRPIMSAIEKIQEELRSARNLDVGFETTDFNINEALDLFKTLDEYSQKSILPSWRGVLNMYCINQAMAILRDDELFPDGIVEKTSDTRDQYDHAIAHVMDEYEKDGDYKPALPSIIALNNEICNVMNDCMVPWRPMDDTLEFMTSSPPVKDKFIREYDGLLARGKRPAMSKAEYCELRYNTEMRKHDTMVEHGQSAVQFCRDLNVSPERGFGDLPDWLVSKLYEKTVDKLNQCRNRLNVRSMQDYLTDSQRKEAEAQQMIVEMVYAHITGREMVSEY